MNVSMSSGTRRAVFDLFRARNAGWEAIERRQRARLAAMLSHAHERSPFYRHLWGERPGAGDLSSLPVVTKPQLMEHFDELVTDRDVRRRDVDEFLADPGTIGRPFLGRYLVATTSGTSGHPGVFMQDELARTVSGAIPRVRGGLTSWYGPRGALRFMLSGRRYALLDVAGGPYAALVHAEWARREEPGLEHSLRFVNVLNSIDEQVAELSEFKPRALGGYPSAVLLMAREQAAGRLHIEPMFIVLVGETVTSATRRVIETTFNCRTYEEYGSGEHGALAVQCREGWLHYSADWFVLEPVDEQYRPVPAGTRSHTVLITNLMNGLMPFIRYDQGDSVLLSPEPCPCGSAFPAIRVTGRKNDLLDLPGRDAQRTVTIAPLSLITVIEETPGLYRAQVIQTAPGTLEIRLQTVSGTAPEAAWPQLSERLRTYLDRQGVGAIELRLSTDPPQQHPKSGKYEQVIRSEPHTATKA